MSILPTEHAVTHLTTQGLLRWLLRSRVATAPPDLQAGGYALPFPWQYKAAAGVGAVLGLAFIALGFAVFRSEPVPITVYLCVMGPMCAAFCWAVYDAMARTLAFSDAGLIRRTRWGHSAHLPWGVVTRVDYSPFSNHFVFRAPGHPTIRVSIYRSGLGTLHTVAARALAHSPVGQSPYLLYEKAANPS